MTLEELSPRQRQVAELTAAGCTNKQIAAVARVSVPRIEAILYAIARVWKLDRSKNLRVQIAARVWFSRYVPNSAS